MSFALGDAVWVVQQEAAGVVVCGCTTPGKVYVSIAHGILFECELSALHEMRWTFLGPLLYPELRPPMTALAEASQMGRTMAHGFFEALKVIGIK